MSTMIQESPLRIIRATDPVTVKHLIFLLYGQPGLGKSSLAMSAEDSLLLNFDSETALARTVNRRDALDILTVRQLRAFRQQQNEILQPFKTIAIDPVGCCIALMTADLIDENPKYGQSDGTLTPKGWGALGKAFAQWMADLKAMGKNIIFVAHQKEEKGTGDTTYMRPDIAGQSKDAVLRLADCVGYIYMNGKKRTIDFNPTEAWFGKNPAQWDAQPVPAIGKAADFIGALQHDARAKLGKISEASAKVAGQVQDWRTAIVSFTAAHEFNRAIPEIRTLQEPQLSMVKKILVGRANALTLTFDGNTNQFIDPKPLPQLQESFL